MEIHTIILMKGLKSCIWTWRHGGIGCIFIRLPIAIGVCVLRRCSKTGEEGTPYCNMTLKNAVGVSRWVTYHVKRDKCLNT